MKFSNRLILLFIFFCLLPVNIYALTNSQSLLKYKYCVSLYRKLKTPNIKNKRQFSSKVIKNCYYLYKITKNKQIKAKCLFIIGKTYQYLTSYYQSEIFADLTIGSFYRLTKEFPRSSLCDDAKYFSAKTYLYYKNIPKLAVLELKQILRKYPKGDYNKRARILLKKIYKKYPSLKYKPKTKKIKKTKKAKSIKTRYHLKRVRCLGFKNFARIVFDFEKLPKFSINKMSSYIKIKLFNTSKLKAFKIITLNKNSIKKKLYFIQRKNFLEVRFKLASYLINSMSYYCLKKPYRLVLDIEIGKKKKFIKPHDTISTIIIDPGHGGDDPGATYFHLQEKDVALKIGKYLRNYLRKKLNKRKYSILLTRSSDKFLSLEQRAKFANEHNADLFVSIHCNATRDGKVYGFETYYLNFSYKRDGYLKRRRGKFSEVDYIIEDLVRVAKVQESIELAQFVQNSIISNLRKRYSDINNLGVKEAPFYVLLETRMPSILVENSFISNRMENRRLRSNRYLKYVAQAIGDGIIKYIKSQKFVK